MAIKLKELPYHKDSSSIFSNIANEIWSIYLDSGYPYISSGRYDIFSARPYKTFLTVGDKTIIQQADDIIESSEDPFSLIRKEFTHNNINQTSLPFTGGAMGYFAYDLGRRIETLPEIAKHDVKMPDMAIGLYDWAVVVDHQLRQTWLVSQNTQSMTETEWEELIELFQNPINTDFKGFKPTSKTESNFTQSSYEQAFNKIKHYIVEGDCYQVNLAQRFSITCEGDAWSAYQHLRQLNPAPFASYMNLENSQVLCSSPERFLKVKAHLVETKPIKGTRRRSVFAYEDTALAQELLESEKDRAENVMIVDLLRNDLGKTCEVGSISVPKLYALESYATVHHLVSTVVGRLSNQTHAIDLLRGCFPGGSITGAPKLRAMEIIEELEPHRRNIYCGSIGYIGYDGNMDTNIAIRTMVLENNKLYCWAGGGIVHDSRCQSEYQESFDKAEAMLKLFSLKPD